MAFVHDWGRAILLGGIGLFWVFAILWGVERLWSRGSPPSHRAVWLALRYTLINLPITALATTGISFLLGHFGVRPVFGIELAGWFDRLGAHYPGMVIAPLIGLIVWDFFYYWLHRAQHAVPFLWRLHSMHHATQELGATTAVQHWSEEFIRAAAVTVPVYLFANIGGGDAAIVSVVFIAMQGYYAHSTMVPHFGPVVRRLFADNYAHRVHHSLEERHWNKNFGAPTMIWDSLFGTAYFPAKGEWPQVGLADLAPPTKIMQFLAWSGKDPGVIDPDGGAAISERGGN